jgi:hypothetical protein
LYVVTIVKYIFDCREVVGYLAFSVGRRIQYLRRSNDHQVNDGKKRCTSEQKEWVAIEIGGSIILVTGALGPDATFPADRASRTRDVRRRSNKPERCQRDLKLVPVVISQYTLVITVRYMS